MVIAVLWINRDLSLNPGRDAHNIASLQYLSVVILQIGKKWEHYYL